MEGGRSVEVVAFCNDFSYHMLLWFYVLKKKITCGKIIVKSGGWIGLYHATFSFKIYKGQICHI